MSCTLPFVAFPVCVWAVILLQSGTAVPRVRTWHDLTKYEEWKKAPAFWPSGSKRGKWQRGWPCGQVNMFRDVGMFELEWTYKVTKLETFMKNRTCSEVIVCSIPNLPHLINQCVVRADFCGSNVYMPTTSYYLCKIMYVPLTSVLPILTIILMDLGCLAIGGHWWYLTPHIPAFVQDEGRKSPWRWGVAGGDGILKRRAYTQLETIKKGRLQESLQER